MYMVSDGEGGREIACQCMVCGWISSSPTLKGIAKQVRRVRVRGHLNVEVVCRECSEDEEHGWEGAESNTGESDSSSDAETEVA